MRVKFAEDSPAVRALVDALLELLTGGRRTWSQRGATASAVLGRGAILVIDCESGQFWLRR